MKITTVILVLYLALMIPQSIVAAPVELPLRAGATRLELLEQSREGLHFRLELGRMTAETVAAAAGEFTRLSLPGGYATRTEGAPRLPLVNELVEVPSGAEVTVEILSTVERMIDLRAHDLPHPLIPVQPPRSKSQDPADQAFAYDRRSYEVEQVDRPLVRVRDCGRLRAVRIGRLEISPVVYHPRDNSLQVTESVEFRLRFSGAERQAEARLKALTASPFFAPVYDRIVGVTGVERNADKADPVRDVVTLVVVAHPDFVEQLADFLAWKTRCGFNVILAVRGAAEVGTTRYAIRNYLHDLYNNATPEQPAPSFVVFAGDVDYVPSWTLTTANEDYYSDRPYCDVDDDNVPDMYYGRLPARDAADMPAMLDKTLMYEQFTMSDPGYLAKACLIVGYDEHDAEVYGNGQIIYATNYYFNAGHGIDCNAYLYPWASLHIFDIVRDVSDGVGVVNYSGHGGNVGWGDPAFRSSDVEALENSEKYCLAIGNACSTSPLEVFDGFSKIWLRVPDKGGIGYIGAAAPSYWNEDYWWSVGVGEIVVDATYEDTGPGAYDGMFHDHGEAMDQWYVTSDAIVFCGNLAVMEAGSPKTDYYWDVYNLMGDPSLSAYLGLPVANPVSHAQTLAAADEFSLSAQPGSYCGLSQNGVLLGAGTVGETGVLDMEIWGAPEPGWAELVVTAQNRVPYIAFIEVDPSSGGIVVSFDPATLAAGVPTAITVGVFAGETPQSGVEVWAEGLGYVSTAALTGPAGTCQLAIDYPFGPSLDICGRVADEVVFREALPVDALLQDQIVLNVVTAGELRDAFPLDLPGTLAATHLQGLPVPPHELWGFLNEQPGVTTPGDSLVLVADEPGDVRAVYAQFGFDLVEAHFPVVEVAQSGVGPDDGPAFRHAHLKTIYPNPFNPRTVISFELSRTCRVELAVFDVRGRRVATLIDGVRTTGSHETGWPGCDRWGTPVVSGIYFAQLRAGGTTTTRKMLLIR